MSPATGRVLLIPFCIVTGCGGHRVAHVAPDESRPHVTWEIRTGGDVGEDDFVCGSSLPAAACVLAASTADRRSLVTVHLYLHAAKVPTSYLGVMQVPFMEGSERLTDKEVSATVPPGSQPRGVDAERPGHVEGWQLHIQGPRGCDPTVFIIPPTDRTAGECPRQVDLPPPNPPRVE